MGFTYSERVVQLGKNRLFVLNMIDVLALDNLMLFHRLDCILLRRVRAEPANLHQTKRT